MTPQNSWLARPITYQQQSTFNSPKLYQAHWQFYFVELTNLRATTSMRIFLVSRKEPLAVFSWNSGKPWRRWAKFGSLTEHYFGIQPALSTWRFFPRHTVWFAQWFAQLMMGHQAVFQISSRTWNADAFLKLSWHAKFRVNKQNSQLCRSDRNGWACRGNR